MLSLLPFESGYLPEREQWPWFPTNLHDLDQEVKKCSELCRNCQFQGLVSERDRDTVERFIDRLRERSSNCRLRLRLKQALSTLSASILQLLVQTQQLVEPMTEGDEAGSLL